MPISPAIFETVSNELRTVLPPAPQVTLQKSGLYCLKWRMVSMSLSVCPGSLGGKNSKESRIPALRVTSLINGYGLFMGLGSG